MLWPVKAVAQAVFGARGQVAVGVLFVVATTFQAWWWGIHGKPGSAAIFWISIEALYFASYGVIATALGYRATERVEAHVVENIDADNVTVD